MADLLYSSPWNFVGALATISPVGARLSFRGRTAGYYIIDGKLRIEHQGDPGGVIYTIYTHLHVSYSSIYDEPTTTTW